VSPHRGLVNGFLAPFRGGIYMMRQRMWAYLLVPLLLNVALAVGALWAASTYWRQELNQHLTHSPVLGWLFLVVTTALGGIVLFVLLQPVLGAIFNDRLSEKVEVMVRGSVPKVPFFASTGKAVVHGLLKLLLYAIALVIGLALTAVVGVGVPVGLGLGALFLAYDGFDYPLARRGGDPGIPGRRGAKSQARGVPRARKDGNREPTGVVQLRRKNRKNNQMIRDGAQFPTARIIHLTLPLASPDK
jgi:uncharacterized protein involved in cysteine biosynthesis